MKFKSRMAMTSSMLLLKRQGGFLMDPGIVTGKVGIGRPGARQRSARKFLYRLE
jgi:hypothetical protein